MTNDDKEPLVPATQPGYDPHRPVTAGRRLNTPAAPPPPRPPAPVDADGALRFDAPPAPSVQPPLTPEEAERRFWARWGPHLLDAFFGETLALPETVAEWTELARAVRDIQQAREAASARVRRAE